MLTTHTNITYERIETHYATAAATAERIALQSALANGRQTISSTGELALLCDRYGCDKGTLCWAQAHPYQWLPHTYAGIYEALLEPHRAEIKSVFECGIGSPHDPQKPGILADRSAIPPAPSIHVWLDYFPNAEIYAADIDPSCMFEAPRVHTAVMDQTDAASIAACFKSLKRQNFDLMIDDGLHTAEGAFTLFEKASKYLAPEGYYFIEDMEIPHLLKLRELLQPLLSNFTLTLFNQPNLVSIDNNLVLLRHRQDRTTAAAKKAPAKKKAAAHD